MAYRKRIKVNVFSKQSVDEAVSELKAQKLELEKLKTAFLQKLGNRMVGFISPFFTTFKVEAIAVGNTVTLTVGGEGLLFVEFGTGTPANSSQGYRWGYVAGSWSSWHANTYEEFLKGNPAFMDANGDYIYNTPPKDAFMHLETQLPTMIRQTAREVFKA